MIATTHCLITLQRNDPINLPSDDRGRKNHSTASVFLSSHPPNPFMAIIRSNKTISLIGWRLIPNVNLGWSLVSFPNGDRDSDRAWSYLSTNSSTISFVSMEAHNSKSFLPVSKTHHPSPENLTYPNVHSPIRTKRIMHNFSTLATCLSKQHESFT